MIKCALQYFLEIKSNVGFRGEGKTGVPGEKPLGVEDQQTQPTYDAEPVNQTRATLVGGKCSDTAPTLLPYVSPSSEVINQIMKPTNTGFPQTTCKKTQINGELYKLKNSWWQ